MLCGEFKKQPSPCEENKRWLQKNEYKYIYNLIQIFETRLFELRLNIYV